MTIHFLPRSVSGRIALLVTVPMPGFVFGTLLTDPRAAHAPLSSYAFLALFFLAQLLFVGWRMRFLEEQLAALPRPGQPGLFAHTTRSVLTTGILFATAFSMTLMVTATLYPKIQYWLEALLASYVATALALLGGFILCAGDQVLQARGSLR